MVLLHMSIVIVTEVIKATYTYAPATESVPPKLLYIPAFYCYNGHADIAHQVVSLVLSLISIGSLIAKILIVRKPVALCNRRKYRKAISILPALARRGCLVLHLNAVLAQKAVKHRPISGYIIIIIF